MMLYLIAFLSTGVALCNAAALPEYLNERHVAVGMSNNLEFERRSVNDLTSVVPLELVNSAYCGNISIGSQHQNIRALFDLGTSQLSALSPNVQYCLNTDPCHQSTAHQNNYDPNLSETATNLTKPFEASVSNATFSGVLYEDSVVLGGIELFSLQPLMSLGLSVDKQPFGLTHEIRVSHSHISPNHYSYAGVAGLSSCSSQGTNTAASFLQSLSTNGHVQSPGFSLWMNPSTSTGEIVFGAVDTSKISGSLYLFNLVNPSSGYSVNLNKIAFSSTGSTPSFPQIESVFDTSTESVILPRSWESIASLFNGQISQNSTLLVPCSSTNANVEFELGSGITISIPISAFVGSTTELDGLCQSPFSFTDGPQFVLGTSFLRHVYLVLNSDSSQGAIAQANFTNNQSNFIVMTPSDPLPNAIVPNALVSNSASESSAATTDTGTGTISKQTLDLVITPNTASTGLEVLTSLSLSTSQSTLSSTRPIPADELLIVSSSSFSISQTAATTSMLESISTPSVHQLVVSPSSSTGTIAEPEFDSGISASSEIGATSTSSAISGASALEPTTSRSNSISIEELIVSTTNSSTTTLLSAQEDLSSTSIISSTHPLLNNFVLSTTTSDPTSGTPTTIHEAIVTGGTSNTIQATSHSNPDPSWRSRNSDNFLIPYTSPSSSNGPWFSAPWPLDPISINVFIQNSIILTTTHRYAPHDFTNVVTVTSTATVTTTVPCSTDPAVTQTITARVLQILIVPSPTPYEDPECTCTKSQITYVDDQSMTKTIHVQPSSPVLLPTQHAAPSVCSCPDCYYTVKKTATLTMTCTAAPTTHPATAMPTWLSAGNTVSATTWLGSMLTILMTIALLVR
jgi:yapsin 1/2